jgi:small subunit ribosomal protein S17
MKAKPKKIERTLHGVVTSTAMDKTIVVKVPQTKKHAKYKKYFTVHKKYSVHYEGEANVKGKTVAFRASKPYAKHKRFVFVRVID